MVLKEEQGRITGEYITNLGDDRIKNRSVPMVGFVSGLTIGFVVAWGKTNSVTSWAGRYLKDNDTGQEFIHTLWHLVREAAGDEHSEEIPLWQAFITNGTVFRKVETVTSPQVVTNRNLDRNVVIIGAGVSGLAAAKAALEEGLNPIVLEKAAQLGGLWRASDGHIWDEMRTNLSHWTCMFSDSPWRKGTSDFPRGNAVETYLNEYATRFGIEPKVRLNSEVKRVEAANSRWRVQLQNGDVIENSNVICSTGVFAKPFIPAIPGIETFLGKSSHGAKYRTATATADRIAVIGAALSGVEIAANLADHGKQVTIAFGHPPWIVPRFVERESANVPLDLMLYRRTVGVRAADDDHFVRYEKTAEFFEETFGNPGIVHPELQVPVKGIAPYVAISDTFLKHVASGRIVPMASKLAAVDHQAIITADGRRAEVDEIIFCTGYESDLSYLSSDVQARIEYNQSDKLIPFLADRTVYNPAVPGLYFVGLYKGPYFAVMELQARWAAMMISSSAPQPFLGDANAAIDAERRLREIVPRPQFPHGNYVEFADSIAGAISVLPDDHGNPDLLEALERGPVVPSHYRLSGPHADFSVSSESTIDAYARTRT